MAGTVLPQLNDDNVGLIVWGLESISRGGSLNYKNYRGQWNSLSDERWHAWLKDGQDSPNRYSLEEGEGSTKTAP
jgi:hypothetical protein